MSEAMQAFQLVEARRIKAQRTARPVAGRDEVLIAVKRVGICGSDIEYYRHFKCGAFVARRPFVLGHEVCGTVAACGADVIGLSVGDRVTVDPSMPCRQCDYCSSGRYNLCRNMRFLGSASVDPHIDGGMREYLTVPARNCHRLPDSLEWSEAAALEPLSIALHACSRAGAVCGKRALISGGGTIGLLVLLTLRSLGAAEVVVSDPVAGRREMAVKLGASAALDPAGGGAAQQGEFQLFFEASGAAQAVETAVYATARGGTVVYIGTVLQDVPLPVNLIMVKELSVLGSFRTVHQFGPGLQLLADRRIDVRPLITHTFPITAVNEAFAATESPQAVKVQLDFV
ncbi:MAG: L-idonate 5-dehydrogenase [Spirochaetaceae bacterium]|nr:MAG: L-idonate 5-dehydrogenase [Spirochaetaceae bacterium]